LIFQEHKYAHINERDFLFILMTAEGNYEKLDKKELMLAIASKSL